MTASFPPDVSVSSSDLSSDLASMVNEYNGFVKTNKPRLLRTARNQPVNHSINRDASVELEPRIEHFLSRRFAENKAADYDPEIVTYHTESLLNTVNNKYRETMTTWSERVEHSMREACIVGGIGGFASMPAIHDWAPYFGVALGVMWGANTYLKTRPDYTGLQTKVKQEILSTAETIQDEHSSGGDYDVSTTPPSSPPDHPRKRL